ncbi:unnamed protein product [marine sediment metagenome]|uniref:DinB-like domain-containing protein n=1 Tax=marine sediment metagenome TaxID=412755 RepID=X0UYV3_9ZZZZ
MGKNVVAAEVYAQFRRAFSMLRGSIEAFGEEEWRGGDIDFLIPCRQAYHAIESVEYYLSEYPGEFKWGHRFDGDWEGMPAGELPTQEEVLDYLDEMQATVDAWLKGLGDEGLLAPQKGFPWTGKTPLGRALYVLRHGQHHLAEMNTELRRRGIDRPDWQ